MQDYNPNPLFQVYTIILNVNSQWPGRAKQSKTLNATVSALNTYGELIITFNDDIQIIEGFSNKTSNDSSVIKMKVVPAATLSKFD